MHRRKNPRRKKNSRKGHDRKLGYQKHKTIVEIHPGGVGKTQTICYMVYTTWQCLCKCVM